MTLWIWNGRGGHVIFIVEVEFYVGGSCWVQVLGFSVWEGGAILSFLLFNFQIGQFSISASGESVRVGVFVVRG